MLERCLVLVKGRGSMICIETMDMMAVPNCAPKTSNHQYAMPRSVNGHLFHQLPYHKICLE